MENHKPQKTVSGQRVKDCNLGDVELFNLCVIGSTQNPEGQSMTGERERAIMLVGTNFLQELLNVAVLVTVGTFFCSI